MAWRSSVKTVSLKTFFRRVFIFLRMALDWRGKGHGQNWIPGNAMISHPKPSQENENPAKKVFQGQFLTEDLHAIEIFYKNNASWCRSVSPVISNWRRTQWSIHLIKGRWRTSIQNWFVQIASSTIFTDKELKKALVIRPGKEFAQSKLDESVGQHYGTLCRQGLSRTEVLADPNASLIRDQLIIRSTLWKAPLSTSTACNVTETLTPKTHVIKREVLTEIRDIFSAGECADRSKKSIILASSTMSRWMSNSPEVLIWLTLFFQWKRESLEFFRQGLVFQVLIDLWEPCKCPTPIFLDWRSAWMFNTNLAHADKILTLDGQILGSWYNMSGGWMFLILFESGIIQATETLSRKTRGVSLRLGPSWSDDFGLLFGYTIEQNDIYNLINPLKKIFPTFGVPKELANETDHQPNKIES